MAGPIRIPTLTQRQPIVDVDRKPTTEFLRTLNGILQQIITLLNAIATLPDIQAQLAELPALIQEAKDAAMAAQNAADMALETTDAAAKQAALVNSYIQPSSVLSATSTAITIVDHTRYYTDGTNVAVLGGVVGATLPGDTDYVYYIDPEHDGGAVDYIVTTSPPVQANNVHVVGAVTIPTTGTAPGGQGPQAPGTVEP